MKISLLILILIVFSSCVGQNDSLFFKTCTCNKIDLSKGVLITDSLDHFQVKSPDYSWKPMRYLTSDVNGLTIGDTTAGYMETFHVQEESFSGSWNMDQEQEEVLKHFNVEKFGDILYKGRICRWNLIHYKDTVPEFHSLHLTYLDSINKKLYTISLTAESSPDIEERICRLESLLDQIKIK